MVGVKEEEHVESSHQRRMRAIVGFVEVVEHVQETCRVAHARRRRNERPSLSHAVRHGGERRGFSHDTEDLLVHDLERLDRATREEILTLEGWVRVGRVRRECGESGREDRHRMRVEAERTDDLLHVAMDHGVVEDLVLEQSVLGGVGQLAVQQEIRRLEVVGLFREDLDRVPPVAQDTVRAVDVGYPRLDHGRVHKAGIEHAEASLVPARTKRPRESAQRLALATVISIRPRPGSNSPARSLKRLKRCATAHLDFVLCALPMLDIRLVELFESSRRDRVVLDWDLDRLSSAVVCRRDEIGNVLSDPTQVG